ncbi:MAG: DUF2384 domain-containing protein [Gammaproteobacteria bacterium]|nr:DUF2384 domain-containing protein [Gammaproteobacteria bacterium]
MKVPQRSLEQYMELFKKVEAKPELYALAKKVLGSDDAASIWLISNHDRLEGQAPINCDEEKVINILLAIEHGNYL